MLDKLEYFIGAGVGIALLIIVLIFRYFLERKRQKLTDRLVEPDDEDDDLGLIPASQTSPSSMEELVANTGLEMDGWQAMAWILLVGILLGSGMFLYRSEWWMAATGMGLGGLLVYVSFFFFKSRYRAQLQAQLPDTFYLIARSLRAGLSLEQALNLVGNQGLQPLAGEFKRCASQIQLGLPISQALDNMSQRLDMIDFSAFVSAISLFQSTGGNLPQLLDRLAGTSRDHVQFRAYFRSATALGRISSYGIAAAGPLIFIAYAFIDPDYIATFFTTRLGILLFFTSVGLEVVGLLWVRYLLKADYS